MAKGHTLVIPKREVNYMFDLEEEEYTGLWAFARKVAMALEQAVPCKRIGIGVLGLEVPHCPHPGVFLLPRQTVNTDAATDAEDIMATGPDDGIVRYGPPAFI